MGQKEQADEEKVAEFFDKVLVISMVCLSICCIALFACYKKS